MYPFNPLSWRFYRSVLLFGCITFALPLFFHAYLGTFMRLNGDEYCYLAVESEHGFWGMQWYSYVNVGGLYNGNRYALNFMHAVLAWLGPMLPANAPAMALSLWIIGMIFALWQVKLFFNWKIGLLQLSFLALTFLFFTLYVAPDVTQIIYWYGGMSQYLSPLILNTYLIGLIFLVARGNPRLWLFPIVLIAFWSGGYSETPSLVQTVYLFILLAAEIVLSYRDKHKLARSAIYPTLTALLVSILALCLLAFAPSTALRLSTQSHPALVDVFSLSIRYGLSFIIQSFLSTPIPYLVSLVITFLLGYVHAQSQEHPASFSLRRISACLLLVLLIWISLTIVSMSPSVYAQNAYPGERALLTARYLSVLAVATTGWLVGKFLATLRLPSIGRVSTVTIAVLFLLLSSLYPLRAVPGILSNLPKFQKWAALWDERDGLIRDMKAQGKVEVEVIKLDHLIDDVGELSEDPAYWYNVCASQYYGITTIRANQPGWDD